jgi:hypothetical protein
MATGNGDDVVYRCGCLASSTFNTCMLFVVASAQLTPNIATGNGDNVVRRGEFLSSTVLTGCLWRPRRRVAAHHGHRPQPPPAWGCGQGATPRYPPVVCRSIQRSDGATILKDGTKTFIDTPTCDMRLPLQDLCLLCCLSSYRNHIKTRSNARTLLLVLI